MLFLLFPVERSLPRQEHLLLLELPVVAVMEVEVEVRHLRDPNLQQVACSF